MEHNTFGRDGLVLVFSTCESIQACIHMMSGRRMRRSWASMMCWRVLKRSTLSLRSGSGNAPPYPQEGEYTYHTHMTYNTAHPYDSSTGGIYHIPHSQDILHISYPYPYDISTNAYIYGLPGDPRQPG